MGQCGTSNEDNDARAPKTQRHSATHQIQQSLRQATSKPLPHSLPEGWAARRSLHGAAGLKG